MCIIAAKPVGLAMPEDRIIENMWYGNDDGAGFMYAEHGSVHIRKGFMNYEAFKQAIDDFCKNHDPLKTALVMHFRITTHGGTKPENCHPFPVSDSVGMLSKLESKGRIGVAHNGIIHSVSPRQGISDTMEYIITQLAPLSRAVPDFYKNKDLCKMISNATGSKLAFLNGNGEIYTIGDFVDDNGIKYSNSSYKWGSLRDITWSRSRGCYSDYGYEDDSYGWQDIPTTGQLGAANEGTFLEIPIMWLDYDFGYLTGVDDYNIDGTFAIGRDGTVYEYDYNLDALRKVPGATAYSNNGTVLHYDRESPHAMYELAYYQFQFVNGKKTSTKKGKGSKK